jgi:hypothetical protein
VSFGSPAGSVSFPVNELPKHNSHGQPCFPHTLLHLHLHTLSLTLTITHTVPLDYASTLTLLSYASVPTPMLPYLHCSLMQVLMCLPVDPGMGIAFLCRSKCAPLRALDLIWHPHCFLMQVTMCSPTGPGSQTASTLLSYAGSNVLPYGPCISHGIHTAFLCRSQCAPLWALNLKRHPLCFLMQVPMCFPMGLVSHMASTQLSYAGHNVLAYGPWISNGVHSAFLCRFQCASLWSLDLIWHPHSFLMQVTMCSPMGPGSQRHLLCYLMQVPMCSPMGPGFQMAS